MSNWPVTAGKLGVYRYTLASSVVAAAMFALPGAAPSSDQVYAPLGLAVMVGLLLTVRLVPYRPGGALVLLPAMVVDARFGLAALPMIAWAAIVTNLIRGMRGPRVVSTAAHLVIAFAVAHLCEQLISVLPGWLVFSVVFAGGRLALWHLAERLDDAPEVARAERPEIMLSLPLAPIGLLPLAAGDLLGDGAMLLAMAALIALLVVVREAANLATARSE